MGRINVKGSICFLAKSPDYEKRKPCVVVPPAKPREIPGLAPPGVKRDFRESLNIEDVRAFKEQLSVEEHGFEVLSHTSNHMDLNQVSECDAYKLETQELLMRHMGAEKVITWGLRKRAPNKHKPGENWDYNNPTEVEGPAIMAHCDFTYDRGLVMVEKFLGKDVVDDYMARGYRIRICNTWRPLVPVIERQPLAICHKGTVDPQDLVACDRVLVDQVGEMFLLQHNPEQKWYWLENQTSEEPFLFCTWDSKFPGQARHSPHVSFAGHNVREDAPPRFSVETRSIVITPPDGRPSIFHSLGSPEDLMAKEQELLESLIFQAVWCSLAI